MTLQRAPSESPDRGFGVYIHWPFCRARCPYCNFNAHVRPRVDAMAYGRALAREIATLAVRCAGRPVASIFFGGGTPSLMPPAAVGLVLDTIARLWPVAADAEVTLEANPTSAEAGNFRGYKSAGVNRLSLGIQALDDDALKALGREHTLAEALGALHLATTIFARVSFDLIYARPGQAPSSWAAELRRALDLGTDHLSLYQLTIEPRTPFAARHGKGLLALPNDDQARELFELTGSLCVAAGLPAYEISNHARPGNESRHNLVYWRYGGYLGIGPGAHSRLNEASRRIALAMKRAPQVWFDAVATHGHGIVAESVLTAKEQAEECLLMGMRLAEGVSLRRLAVMTGLTPAPDTIQALSAEGFLVFNGHDGTLKATDEGRLVLNAVILELTGCLMPVESTLAACVRGRIDRALTGTR
ncbi:MAG: radical SAM family heme chaperone HemW [Hyphomicrobiales bacterium]